MAKYKLYGINADGDSKLVHTENHPKLDATEDDMSAALTAVTGVYEMQPDKIVMTSDTTIFTAE